MWKYYQNEPKCHGVYLRNIIPQINDRVKSIGTHWIALYMNVNNIIHFYSFGVEHIPEET